MPQVYVGEECECASCWHALSFGIASRNVVRFIAQRRQILGPRSLNFPSQLMRVPMSPEARTGSRCFIALPGTLHRPFRDAILWHEPDDLSRVVDISITAAVVGDRIKQIESN